MTATYNVCVVRPAGYPHADAFIELAELLRFGLRDLGIEARGGVNEILADARNIVIGCHLLDPAQASRVPPSTIIVNTEQIQRFDPGGEPPETRSVRPQWQDRILRWLARFEAWDYSPRNIERLRDLGIGHVKHLRIGHHAALARIPRAAIQDIDVLFYGSRSPRRDAVLDELRRRGLAVRALFGVYGAERDRLIARSKVVLNVHLMRSQIFEIVRVFYLMTNAKAVVGEVNPETSLPPGYRDGICGVPYAALPDACVRLVRDEPLRRRTEAAAVAAISAQPQAEMLRALLSP